VENFSKTDTELAKQLIITARRLVAVDEEDEDPKMSEKLRQLRPLLTKLNSKRNKTLKQMGVAQNIKTTAKVEDLVDMLISMTNQGG
jgi:hypothetical protein